MTKTGYTVILGQLFKCVATDGKMELIEEKIGGQLSCKTCGLKVSKILLEGRKWWRCGECGTRNYTMPRNPESLKSGAKGSSSNALRRGKSGEMSSEVVPSEPANPESLPDWAENYLSDTEKWNKEHEKKKED